MQPQKATCQYEGSSLLYYTRVLPQHSCLLNRLCQAHKRGSSPTQAPVPGSRARRDSVLHSSSLVPAELQSSSSSFSNSQHPVSAGLAQFLISLLWLLQCQLLFRANLIFFQSPYHLYFWNPIFWNIGTPQKGSQKRLDSVFGLCLALNSRKGHILLTKKLCFSVHQKLGLGLPSQPKSRQPSTVTSQKID